MGGNDVSHRWDDHSREGTIMGTHRECVVCTFDERIETPHVSAALPWVVVDGRTFTLVEGHDVVILLTDVTTMNTIAINQTPVRKDLWCCTF